MTSRITAAVSFTDDGTSLTLLRSSVTRNATEAGDGGGIAANGDLVLRDSAVTGNLAGVFGGGIFGSINPITLTNSTVADNRGDCHQRRPSVGDVSFTDSTLTGNYLPKLGVVSITEGADVREQHHGRQRSWRLLGHQWRGDR